jgi:hypothetical protein
MARHVNCQETEKPEQSTLKHNSVIDSRRKNAYFYSQLNFQHVRRNRSGDKTVLNDIADRL